MNNFPVLPICCRPVGWCCCSFDLTANFSNERLRVLNCTSCAGMMSLLKLYIHVRTFTNRMKTKIVRPAARAQGIHPADTCERPGWSADRRTLHHSKAKASAILERELSSLVHNSCAALLDTAAWAVSLSQPGPTISSGCFDHIWRCDWFSSIVQDHARICASIRVQACRFKCVTRLLRPVRVFMRRGKC